MSFIKERTDTSSTSSETSHVTSVPFTPDLAPIKEVVDEEKSTKPGSNSKLLFQTPEYMVYKDSDLDVAASSGVIPNELRHRLIRATVSNMQAAAYSSPFNRRPNNMELNEMAKSLCLTYPCLADKDSGHVSDCCTVYRSCIIHKTLYMMNSQDLLPAYPIKKIYTAPPLKCSLSGSNMSEISLYVSVFQGNN